MLQTELQFSSWVQSARDIKQSTKENFIYYVLGNYLLSINLMKIMMYVGIYTGDIIEYGKSIEPEPMRIT